MTDRRKVKKRKECYELVNKTVDKPTKDELIIAKWMKKNIAVKKTKFAGHNVEYFTGSKAVDVLQKSEWCAKEENKEALFITRQDIVYFLDAMLRHRFFHRAKKVPVSEQELKAKYGKREKKNAEEDKKKKDEETAESSHAEYRDVEDKIKTQVEDRKKKCCKIKLEMHSEQTFVDNLDAYVWIYDPIPLYYWIIGALVVLATVGVCLFPLWPPTVRMGVQYISMAAAGFLILILALAVLRLIIFCLIWLITLGTFHLWLLPNLTEDVGFFASFWPLYQYAYAKKKDANAVSAVVKKDKKQKKKKDKDSDDEDTDQKTDKISNQDKSQSDSESSRNKADVENDDTINDHEGAVEAGNSDETDTESSNGQKSQTGKDFEMIDNTNDFEDDKS